MSSYISKVIVFFIFIYALLISTTIINAFADGNITTNKISSQQTDQKENIDVRVNESSKIFFDSNTNQENDVKKNSDTSNADTPNIITRNLQTVSNILSSSPAELAEQAKSYALGKFNRTVASEAQKWLSQFGSARINFGLDKKGTLENNSLDILLPLYDNKTDWLLFSQLGYRNKDSRNTLNAGLGGRYFQQNWMYGLNIFYDHDLTGKNQRLGLGGEIWGDYIKLSANTYWRLSDWQNSQSLKDYHERPANGYDINGEFFLPAYPNLGAKLSYEQYFGDNVTLFNRDTRQNNPSLAKLGLTYTPIPLFTLGVDYKQGGSGHTETQFLANLNYKFGIPLSTQLSPDNITSMRTLAGSRYDLVERNNTIVLEHQKKPIAQLSLPKTITGYSREQHDVTVKISSHTPVKQIHWATNQDFENHGGKLSSNVGQTIKITLPNYLSDENRNNHYPIYALAEWEDNQKSAPVQMNVIVRPFKVKTREEANFTPPGPLPATGHKEDGYLFDPVITFDTVNHAPIKNAAIDNVQWITDPKTGSDSGLQFIDWEKSAPAALDENGHFKRKPVLTSTQPHQDVKVYLQLDGQPQQLVGEVSFNENPASFYADKVEVSPQVPSLVADGTQTYTYSATILGSDNKPVKNQKIADVQWDTNKKEIAGLNLKWESTTTDNDGKLTAGLTSTVPVNAVTVSLVIGNHKPVSAKDPVSFTANTPIHRIQDNALHIDPPGPLTADGHHYYTYTAVIVDQQNNPVKNHKMPHVKWRVMQGNQDESTNKKLIWQPKEGDVTTDGEGKLTATLGSNYVMDNLMVSLSIENHGPVSAPSPVSFTADTQSYHIKDSLIDVDPKNNLTADGVQKYTYTAVILDRNNQPVRNEKINNVIWDTNKKGIAGLNLKWEPITDNDGKLTASLTSTEPATNITVSLTIENQKAVEVKQAVSFEPEQLSPITVSPPSPILVNNTYTLKVKVKDTTGKNSEPNKKVNWTIKDPAQKGVTLTPTSSTTDASGDATTTLTSTQAQKVTVVASVEGIKTPQSVDVEFVPPPVDFEIASVEVYAVEIGGSEKPFDKTKPLLGNGVDKYKYRALMTKKGSNGKDPIKNHLFSGVVWTRDQTQIDDKYLPQPEETSSKTDNQGYLYATLGSHVGVGKDIEVTLQIPTQKGGKQIGKTDQNNLVRFDPVPQQAVMHAYNINREKEVYQTFKEPHPYNFFISLATKLRSAAKPNSDFNTSELTYNFIATDPPENPYMVNFGKDNKGPITFQQYGKGVIQALINKSNGVIELYEYKLNVGRALAFMGGKELYYSAKDHHSCETINSVSIQSTPYIDDFQSNYKGVAINNEFNNLYEWGLFGNDEQIKNNLKIKIRDSSRDYIIYDANKHKIDYSYVPKGMIVCIK